MEPASAGSNPKRRCVMRREVVMALLVVVSLAGVTEVDAEPSRSRRRPVTRPAAQAPLQARYVIERADAEFGVVHPGESRELSDALVVRVFSDSGWTLSIVPVEMTISSGVVAEPIGARRLSTRANRTEWQELNEALPTILARGSATTGAGEQVVIDLRIALEDTDPAGHLGGTLALILEPM